MVQPAKKFSQPLHHLRRRLGTIRWPYQHVQCAKALLLKTEGLANAALEAIAFNCERRVLSRYQNAKARRAAYSPFQVERITTDTAALAVLQKPHKHCALRQAPFWSKAVPPCPLRPTEHA